MPQQKAVPSLIRNVSLIAVLLLSASPVWAGTTGSTTVVISQMYGAGGNSGATYNADFIELFNLSSSSVSLDGYAIQYASAGGATISFVASLPSGITLQPGQRYLISGTPGANGVALPATPDTVISTIAIAATAGKVYLTSSVTQLTSSCPGTGGAIVDFIGYGTTASCFEGSTFAPAPSTTTADIRANGGCTDTDQNGTDFTTGTPTPRNSSSTATPCASTTPTPLALTAAIAPSPVNTGSATLLKATVTPATVPSSTGLAVTADTSALGGSATQPLYDDGTHGDVTAGDSIYSYSLTVPSSQAANTYTVTFKVSDTQLRSATASAPLVVQLANVASSNVVLSTSASTAVAGNGVTFSAVVTGNQATAPTGTVTFKDGTNTIGTSTISGTTALFSTTALGVGTHSITAVYGGDSLYPAFTSNAVTVTITAAPVPDFTVSVANLSVDTTGNAPTGTTVVTVSMINGFSQTVSLSCSGLPSASRCTFAPASLTATGSSVLTVAVDGASAKPLPWARGGTAVLAVLLIGVPLAFRRRRWATGLLLGVVIVAISGCGSSNSTAAGSSTITVTGTAGSVTHSTTFTLNVH